MSWLFSLENNSIAYHPSTFNTTTNHTDSKVVYSDDFWIGFKRFLSQDRLNYARHYVHILQTEDALELLVLSNDKRIHAIESFVLAKYTGCYDKWNQIYL
jgi:hypothetical protein